MLFFFLTLKWRRRTVIMTLRKTHESGAILAHLVGVKENDLTVKNKGK